MSGPQIRRGLVLEDLEHLEQHETRDRGSGGRDRGNNSASGKLGFIKIRRWNRIIPGPTIGAGRDEVDLRRGRRLPETQNPKKDHPAPSLMHTSRLNEVKKRGGRAWKL